MSMIETLLATPPGFRSEAAARFVWQLDEQRRLLLADTRGLTPADLEWQPRPGMNTRGMLLAHIAFAEANLAEVGLFGKAVGRPQDVIGLTEEEEGMPLVPGAPPAPALAGKSLAYFVDLLAKARAHTRAAAVTLSDDDLERRIERPKRPDGTQRVFNPGWVLYHLIEHEAGHRAQINLIGHLQKSM